MATVGNWQGYTELVELLLEKSADVERRDRGGATALVWACAAAGEAAGDVGPATALVAAGASVNSRGWDMGDTPLLCAVSGGHTELAQLLIGAGAELGVADEAGRGVVDVAVEGSLPDLANALIEAGAPCDLGCACALGDVALVERLLDDASGRGVGGAGGAGGGGGNGGASASAADGTADPKDSDGRLLAYTDGGLFLYPPHTIDSVYECTIGSGCGAQCKNRLVQRGPKFRLEVRAPAATRRPTRRPPSAARPPPAAPARRPCPPLPFPPLPFPSLHPSPPPPRARAFRRLVVRSPSAYTGDPLHAAGRPLRQGLGRA